MKYRKKAEHNGDNYLKAILESIFEYNSIARLDVANLLYIGYKDAISVPEKHAAETIVLELISKLMQTFEDLSVLLMMFEKPLTSDQRWKVYMKYQPQDILQFLHRARKGLSKTAVMSITALKSANDLYKEGVIRKSELSHFKKIIDEEITGHQKTLLSMAKAYIGNKRRKQTSIEPSLILGIYHKTKHGFKVIHPTETAKKIWTFNEGSVHMVTHIKKWPWGREMLPLTSFIKFTPENVEMLVGRIKEWSELQSNFAQIQNKKMENPYWFVPEIRAIKTQDMLKTLPRPGRNDDCLCGSEMKFKKCCESRVLSISTKCNGVKRH